MHYLATATIAWVTLGVVGASAADRPAKRAEPPAFTWEGFHIGANFGAAFPTSESGRLQAGSGFATNAFDLYPPNRDRAGAVVGAQVGYDWQIGQWVYGVETDFNFLDVRRSATGLFPTPASYWPGATSYGLTSDENGNYFASFRGRLGFAVDRTLFYVTGGVATGGWRGASNLIFFNPAPVGLFQAPISQSSRMKYAVGAGVEYALYDQWSARLEYLYLNQQLQTRVYDNGQSVQYGARQRSEAHVLRFGLNYRFGVDDEARATSDDDKGDEAKSDKNASKTRKSDAKKDENGDESKAKDAKSNAAPERYSVHGQSTGVVQGYPKFPALYSGQKSFTPKGQARFGSTTNLFLGLRLWDGGAVYLNPEISEGYGLSNSAGAASFVNGAVAKVGRAAPYMRFQRYFLRQIIGLNGGAKESDPDTGSLSETLESTQNQISGKVDKDRLILTVGKFAVGDVFDDNVYAHDPTTGFLNFAFNTMGAFDYAADAWGYTYGAALEWKQDWWTARAGAFQLSDVPNSEKIEPVLGRQFMGVAEFEARYDLLSQPGVVKFLAFADNGYLNKVEEVIDFSYLTGSFPPDITNNALRKRRVKFGGGVNIQQQLMPDLGFFLRASMSDGRYETVDYTDIDRSLSTGLVAGGKLWGRPKDEIGGGVVFSGLMGPRVRYFALGGTSVYIGDGALSYGGEKAVETYYKLNLSEGIDVSFDYQFVGNPGHNLDRGPVNIFGVRLHGQF